MTLLKLYSALPSFPFSLFALRLFIRGLGEAFQIIQIDFEQCAVARTHPGGGVLFGDKSTETFMGQVNTKLSPKVAAAVTAATAATRQLMHQLIYKSYPATHPHTHTRTHRGSIYIPGSS